MMGEFLELFNAFIQAGGRIEISGDRGDVLRGQKAIRLRMDRTDGDRHVYEKKFDPQQLLWNNSPAGIVVYEIQRGMEKLLNATPAREATAARKVSVELYFFSLGLRVKIKSWEDNLFEFAEPFPSTLPRRMQAEILVTLNGRRETPQLISFPEGINRGDHSAYYASEPRK